MLDWRSVTLHAWHVGTKGRRWAMEQKRPLVGEQRPRLER